MLSLLVSIALLQCESRYIIGFYGVFFTEDNRFQHCASVCEFVCKYFNQQNINVYGVYGWWLLGYLWSNPRASFRQNYCFCEQCLKVNGCNWFLSRLSMV